MKDPSPEDTTTSIFSVVKTKAVSFAEHIPNASTPLKSEQQQQQQQHQEQQRNISGDSSGYHPSVSGEEIENEEANVSCGSDEIIISGGIMRQISILQVYDPFTNEFISVTDAVKKGIFNETTFQYNDYVNNKTYTITDAAKRGFFKTEVNNELDEVIVEKLRVTQTFELVSACDPFNLQNKLSVNEAIKLGYIDLVASTYYHAKDKRTVSLSDAIEEGLVDVKLMNETYEKIKETLVEKTNEAEKHRKETETLTTIEEDGKPMLTQRTKTKTSKGAEVKEELKEESIEPKYGEGSVYVNRLAVMEKKKTKVAVKKDENRKDLPSALVKDLNTNRLIDINEAIKKGIFNESNAMYYNKVNLNKAIEQGHIILPDSDFLVENIEFVKDIKENADVTVDVAVERGIIDKKRKLFKNTKTNRFLTLYEALHAGVLVLYEDDDDSEDEDAELTIDDIVTVFNPSTGEQIGVEEALKIGLLNKRLNAYIEPKTRRRIKLNDAVQKGLASRSKMDETDEVLAIRAIYDPASGQTIPLKDAIEQGIIDYTESTFTVPGSKQVITIDDAFDRGYLITSLIEPKNEEKKPPLSEPRKSPLSDSVDNKIRITSSTPEPKKAQNIEAIEIKIDEKPLRSSNTGLAQVELSEINSTFDTNKALEDDVFEKVSSPKKKSLLQVLRSKLSISSSKRPRKLTQNGVVDEETIADCLIFIDTKTRKEYTLEKAVSKSFIVNPNEIYDTKKSDTLTLCEALSKSVIYFDVDEDLKYSKIDNTFYDTHNLYIIYHVNEPQTKKKLNLVEAIRKGYLNKHNTSFTDKQITMSLTDAIDKGHVAGAVVRLHTLNDVIKNAVTDKRSRSPSKAPSESNASSRRAPSKSRSIDASTIRSDDEGMGVAQRGKIVPKKVLEKSGRKFDKSKSYYIDRVHDPARDREVSYAEAVKLRLIDDRSLDYIDVMTGKVHNLARAIQKGWIKVAEVKKTDNLSPSLSMRSNLTQASVAPKTPGSRSKLGSSLDRSQTVTPEIKPRTPQIKNTNSLPDSRPSRARMTDFGATKSSTPRTVTPAKTPDNAKKQLDEQQIQAFINRTFNSLDAEVAKLDSLALSSIQINTADVSADESQYEGNFGIIKYILYYLAKDARYISFEEVINRDLYNTETGKIIDAESNAELTIYEALNKNVLKLNNSNLMYDKTHLYLIDNVLDDHDKRVTLCEAANVNLIDRDRCTYRHKNSIFLIQAAMKDGFIEGRIIDDVVLKLLLDDYVKKVQESHEANRKKRMLEKLNTKIELIEPLNKSKDTQVKSRSYLVNQVEEIEEVLKPAYIAEEEAKEKEKEESLEKIAQVVEKVQVASKLETMLDAKPVLSPSALINAKTTGTAKIAKNTFDNMFIIDPDSLNYISIHDAVKKGLIDTKTGEIKDFDSLNNISIKHVITRGNVTIDATRDQPYYHKSSLYVHNRSSYIIDSVVDLKNNEKYSIHDANKHGLFANGIYKNPLNSNTYQLDEAIELGYVIGKKVYLNTIENDFIEYLMSPPQKPTRGVYADVDGHDHDEGDSTFFNDNEEDYKPKTVNIGKIGGVKDLRTGKCYKPADAEKLNLLNISQGWFRNSNTMEFLQISDAIEQNFILLESVTAPSLKTKKTPKSALENRPVSPLASKSKSRSPSRSRRQSKVSSIIISEPDDELKNEFIITSVLDPLNKAELSIDEAISKGLFDANTGMYNDPLTLKKLTMVDAIDQGLIKITSDMRTSYKVTVDQDKTHKNVKTFSIRYVVDTQSGLIIPINEATKQGLVNTNDGTLHDSSTNAKINLTDAYDKGLALTIDDLNNSFSTRCQFRVELVRNIKSGKEMTLKSALAKNWLSLERRIYYNKYLKEEMPISQALDMKLIVLKIVPKEELAAVSTRSRSQHRSDESTPKLGKRNLSESNTRTKPLSLYSSKPKK